MPSSAVTRTERVLSPTWRSALPVTATEAEESVGIAVTATASVPYGRITVPPSATRAPETLNTARELTLDGLCTFKVTL